MRTYAEAETRPEQGFYYGYVIVIAAAIIYAVAIGVFYSFGVFFKPLLADFGWTRAEVSSASSIAWIVQSLTGIASGGLSDKLGPRKVITFSGFILGLGYMLMWAVNDLWQMYLFYGVMAGGAIGGIVVPLFSAVARWFARRRGTMTGIAATGMGIGTLIAPPVASWLIMTYDWRVSYLVLGSVVMVMVVSMAQLLRREPARKGPTPFSEDRSALKANGAGMPARDAIRTRQFWMTALIFLCLSFSLYMILVHIVPYATDIKIEPTIAAGTLSAIGGVSILGKVLFGNIGDRTGSRNVYIISFSLMFAALLMLSQTRGIAALYLFAIVFGLAYGGGAATQSPLIATFFGLKSHGLILALGNIFFCIGAAAGPYIAGYIFDVTGSYQLAFLIAAAFAASGIALSVALKPIRKTAT